MKEEELKPKEMVKILNQIWVTCHLAGGAILFLSFFATSIVAKILAAVVVLFLVSVATHAAQEKRFVIDNGRQSKRPVAGEVSELEQYLEDKKRKNKG